jgi:molecular chaperone GrpE
MAQNHEGVKEDFLKGIQMIYDRFIAIMEQHSIRGESMLGKAFDPNSQQALASVPTDEHAPNTVIEEFKRAYYFKDKLLRPAQVVVAIPDENAGKSDTKSGETEPGSVH